MMRHYKLVLLGAATLVALSGCAYQDPLALPDLGPPSGSSQPYPGYSPYYGYGSTYGQGAYGYNYGSGYRPGYDPYYYRGGYPQYYSPGVVYVPYPVPCVDENRNGRCDKRPPKNRDNDGDGQHGGDHDGNDGRDNPGVRPPYLRDVQRPGDGPRVRRDIARDAAAVAPAPRQVAPAQARPQQPPPPRRVAPARQVEREARPGPRHRPGGDDRPAQEP